MMKGDSDRGKLERGARGKSIKSQNDNKMTLYICLKFKYSIIIDMNLVGQLKGIAKRKYQK